MKRIKLSGQARDLSGETFGRLKVIMPVSRNRAGRIEYLCHCACGKEHVASGNSIKKGMTTSCGCYLSEVSKRVNTTHGMRKSTEYASWLAMKRRCSLPTDVGYKYYGGKGITVCKAWDESFEAFFADMGFKPGKGYDIDRIDPDGNYEPGNCQWLKRSENVKKMHVQKVRENDHLQ